MSADDFIFKLDKNREKASEIHRELERLTTALVKKTFGAMFGRFEDDDVTEVVNETFLIVYTNNDRGKILDFSNPPQSLQSYFWRVAENLCKKSRRDKFRENKFDSLSDEDSEGNVKQFASPSENPEAELIRRRQEKIYRDCLSQALNELENKDADKYRMLFSYTNDAGKTAHQMKIYRDDLAASYDMTPANLTLKINRVREKLRERLQRCLAAKNF